MLDLMPLTVPISPLPTGGTSGGSPDLSLVRDEWQRLADLVREYDPTVVILVARKPVRMFQALHLDPVPGAVVISDLAIPFMEDLLKDARIAIVDDVVNVGSTMRRAAGRAFAAGASEVQSFAISYLERDISLDDLEVNYSGSIQGLDQFGLQQFARRIPEALQWLPKPYDLDFPVIDCSVRSPFHSFAKLLAALSARHGEERVYDLSTAAGSEHGMRRCAVDLSDGAEHRKVRLYFDERRATCAVVPICIAPVLRGDATPLYPSPWAQALWDALKNRPKVEDEEARCRLRLFVDALSMGEVFIAEHSGFLQLLGDRPFNVEDAQLALGSAVNRVEPISTAPHWGSRPIVSPESYEAAASPFLAAAEKQGFVEILGTKTRGRDPLSVFIACFEELASWVGANDPSQYRLNWPYTLEEVSEDPYLRLRVGPTLVDLVLIVDTVTATNDIDLTRRRVTRLLDRYIDAGGVVPTVATYEGAVYRIYRQGESSTRDDVSRKVRYAWNCYGKPLSLTRAAKYLTILALDQTQGSDSQVQIEAAPRGNTLCFHPSVLDNQTEITHYLRNTSQLRPADDE